MNYEGYQLTTKGLDCMHTGSLEDNIQCLQNEESSSEADLE